MNWTTKLKWIWQHHYFKHSRQFLLIFIIVLLHKFESFASAFVCFEISTLLKLEISSLRRVENFKLQKGWNQMQKQLIQTFKSRILRAGSLFFSEIWGLVLYTTVLYRTILRVEAENPFGLFFSWHPFITEECRKLTFFLICKENYFSSHPSYNPK